jgi:hypothetical protein
MADDFEKFKKMYKEGEVKVLANPPPMPGAGGLGRLVGGAVSTAGRKKLMDTLNKSKEKGQKARSAKEGRTGGTFTDKIKNTRTRERTPKEKEKFGALVKREDRMPAVIKREDRMPAVQGSRALVKREDRMPAVQGGRALVKREDRMPAVQGSRSVSAVRNGTRTFGDKGQGGRIVGFSNKGKLALGAGAAGTAAMLYKAADMPKASDNKANNSKLTSGARDDRASSGGGSFKPINRDNLSEQGKKTFDGKQGQSKTKKPVVKKDGPKAGPAKKAEKPMSNFERMKKRGYEKEGFGGRSVTSRGAESRVKKERSFKFKDLFAKKKK